MSVPQILGAARQLEGQFGEKNMSKLFKMARNLRKTGSAQETFTFTGADIKKFYENNPYIDNKLVADSFNKMKELAPKSYDDKAVSTLDILLRKINGIFGIEINGQTKNLGEKLAEMKANLLYGENGCKIRLDGDAKEVGSKVKINFNSNKDQLGKPILEEKNGMTKITIGDAIEATAPSEIFQDIKPMIEKSDLAYKYSGLEQSKIN